MCFIHVDQHITGNGIANFWSITPTNVQLSQSIEDQSCQGLVSFDRSVKENACQGHKDILKKDDCLSWDASRLSDVTANKRLWTEAGPPRGSDFLLQHQASVNSVSAAYRQSLIQDKPYNWWSVNSIHSTAYRLCHASVSRLRAMSGCWDNSPAPTVSAPYRANALTYSTLHTL